MPSITRIPQRFDWRRMPTSTDRPFLLAGGGLPGKWHDAGHRPHNDLLLALCNLLGDGRTTFGDPKFCTGPLGGLT